MPHRSRTVPPWGHRRAAEGSCYLRTEHHEQSERAVRDDILRFLHEVHQNAKSPRSAGIGIRDLQKVMKTQHGYKQQAVASNLDYLLQKRWVVPVVEQRTFQTGG